MYQTNFTSPAKSPPSRRRFSKARRRPAHKRPSHSCEGRNFRRRKAAGNCTPSATVCAFRR
ncbi:MAG: hypothetical protein ACR2QC_09990 [Gammaproteobacteria bacterium]